MSEASLSQDPGLDKARAVLGAANREHRTSFRLVRRLPGGYQTGAYELRDDRGRRAVLKYWGAHRPLSRLEEAAATVAAARRAGWPTPAWLHYGLDGEGVPYEIQEFVTGTHREVLDEATLELLLEVNSLQADLDLPTTHDWSAWTRKVIYEDEGGQLAQVRAASEAGRRLGETIDELRNQAGVVRFPDRDLVCGVFALENILFHQDRVAGVIDVGALGKGCRATDLAVLYGVHALWGEGDDLTRRIRGAAESVAGPEAFALFVVTELLGVLAFGLDHWPEGVDQRCDQASALLRGLM